MATQWDFQNTTTNCMSDLYQHRLHKLEGLMGPAAFPGYLPWLHVLPHTIKAGGETSREFCGEGVVKETEGWEGGGKVFGYDLYTAIQNSHIQEKPRCWIF